MFLSGANQQREHLQAGDAAAQPGDAALPARQRYPDGAVAGKGTIVHLWGVHILWFCLL